MSDANARALFESDMAHDQEKWGFEPEKWDEVSEGTKNVYRRWVAEHPTSDQPVAEPVLSGQDSGECEHGDHGACDGTTPGWECLCSCHTTDQSIGGV